MPDGLLNAVSALLAAVASVGAIADSAAGDADVMKGKSGSASGGGVDSGVPGGGTNAADAVVTDDRGFATTAGGSAVSSRVEVGIA